MKLVVLGSGGGGDFAAVTAAMACGLISEIDICGVIATNSNAGILDIAKSEGIPSTVISRKEALSREGFDESVFSKVQDLGAGMVLLTGYKYLLPAYFIDAFKNRILNSHPALLPAFPGMFLKEQMLEHNCKFLGATVHIVDAGMDTGTILTQAVWPKVPGEKLETVLNMFRWVQDVLYVNALRNMICDGVNVKPSFLNNVIFNPGLDRSMTEFTLMRERVRSHGPGELNNKELV